ncbi:MAG TPA: segregation/condensation protein A [Chloroflexota bacterium]
MSAADAPFALKLEGFDGPLDLLLALIERHELDITTISLARVADDYLAHVRSRPTPDPELLSAFIAVAARLLLIKSAVLLPRPRHEETAEVEDPTDLTERLREYEAFRRAAASLREREESGLRSYLRLAPLDPPARQPRAGGAEPQELLRALERVAAVALREAAPELVRPEPFTIGQKIALLRSRCDGGGCASFKDLLAGCGRAEIVATFLAVLELLRLAEIEIRQDERYGDIHITRRTTEQ